MKMFLTLAALLSTSVLVLAQETTFDVSKKNQAQGRTKLKTKKIQHPGAKEGLYLIDEEGVYHYRTENISSRDHSMFLRFMSLTTPEIQNSTNTGDFTYADVYGEQNLSGLDFVYEWQPFKSLGKAGVQFGAGFATATGNGFFANGDLREPRERYTFISVPLALGIVYRFEFLERQWFAPYVAGGGLYNVLIESRNDGKITTVGASGGYGSAGAMINLTALNKDLAFTMDRVYSFSQLWIIGEYRRIQSFNDDLDITANQISFGVGADY